MLPVWEKDMFPGAVPQFPKELPVPFLLSPGL